MQAAPRPWKKRAPRKNQKFGARAAANSDAENITMPMVMTFLRPYWSPSLPMMGANTVSASEYRISTSAAILTAMPKWRVTLGSAGA